MAVSKVIDVRSAELRTASVEIKSLIVDGRKMTLSVFRQIPAEDILHFGTGTLMGIPWGAVNYFWGDQPESGTHVLWQKDNELRRCVVESWWRGENAQRILEQKMENECIGLEVTGNRYEWGDEIEEKKAYLRQGFEIYRPGKLKVFATSEYYDLSDKKMPMLSFDLPLIEPEEGTDEGMNRLNLLLMKSQKATEGTLIADERYKQWAEKMRENLEPFIRPHRELEGRVKGHLQNLRNLPQLFIAV